MSLHSKVYKEYICEFNFPRLLINDCAYHKWICLFGTLIVIVSDLVQNFISNTFVYAVGPPKVIVSDLGQNFVIYYNYL